MPAIVYNGYTLPNVFGKFSVGQDEKKFTFSCTFLVASDTEAGLVAAIATAEEKLSEKWKDLTITLGATLEYSFSHSVNTGFLAQPNLSVLTNSLHTGRSRAYKFSVTVGLPFDQSGFAYRRDGSFTINYDKSRRRSVSFRCTYTAGGGDSSLVKYEAGGKTWAASVLTALGGTYELVSETIQEEMEEKILNATLAYREIIAYQKSGSLDEVKVVDPECHYSVDYGQQIGISEAGYQTYPSVTVTLSYSASVDKEQVPAENDVEDVYQDVIKPWLIQHAYDLLGMGDYSQAGQNYIVQAEKKSVDPYNYRFSGNLTLAAPKSLDQIMHLSEIITTQEQSGISAEKMWDGVDYSHNTYSIGAQRTMSRVITITKLGSEPSDPSVYDDKSKGKWIKLTSSKRREVMEYGCGTHKESRTHNVYAYSVTFVEQYIYVVPIKISPVQVLD